MPTNEQHDHFHFFVYRKLWTVLLVWASMLWLDWEDIWVSKTFFLVQLVSFFNNTPLCEKKKKKQRWSLSHCTRGEIPHVDVLKVIVEFPLYAVLHGKLSFFFYFFFLFFIFILFYAEIKVSDSPSSVWQMHNFIFSVHSHSLFLYFYLFLFLVNCVRKQFVSNEKSNNEVNLICCILHFSADENKTPENPAIRKSLSSMFTPYIAKQLSNDNPKEVSNLILSSYLRSDVLRYFPEKRKVRSKVNLSQDGDELDHVIPQMQLIWSASDLLI